MNKSLAKLLSSAVVLGSVFFSLQTTASPQDWQRIKRPIPATDGKANPIGSYSNVVLSGRSHCLIKVRAIKLFV